MTVPIGAVFVYGYNFDLQGLVAAVTIGYSVSSTVLLYLLIRSNWEKRVHKVQKTICEAGSLSSDIDEQSSIDFSNNEKLIVGIQDVNLGKLESDTQITANVRMRSFSEVMDLVDQLEDTDLVDQLEEAIRQSKSLREDT